MNGRFRDFTPPAPGTPGAILRDSRMAANMSQADLAVAAFTTQSAISRIERNRLNPSIGTLERLVSATGARLVIGTRR